MRPLLRMVTETSSAQLAHVLLLCLASNLYCQWIQAATVRTAFTPSIIQVVPASHVLWL